MPSTRQRLLHVALGQMLSLSLVASGTTSQLLANRGLSFPVLQNSLFYLLLYLIHLPSYIKSPSQPCCVSILDRSSSASAKCMRLCGMLLMPALALADVEGNYLVVTAFKFTTITHVQLLDCFTVPCVIFLSFLFLKRRYNAYQHAGATACVAGLVILVAFSPSEGPSQASNVVLGDALVLGGAFLYAVSNVGQEHVVRSKGSSWWLFHLGAYGSVLSLAQAAVVGELTGIFASQPGWADVGLFFAFTCSQMLLYLCVPKLLIATGATFLNLSLLTSDFFAVAIGVLLFGDQVPAVYAAAFACTVGGLLVFHVKTVDVVEIQNNGVEGVLAAEGDGERLLRFDGEERVNAPNIMNHAK